MHIHCLGHPAARNLLMTNPTSACNQLAENEIHNIVVLAADMAVVAVDSLVGSLVDSVVDTVHAVAVVDPSMADSEEGVAVVVAVGHMSLASILAVRHMN